MARAHPLSVTGQSTLQFAVLMAVIVSALLTMQVYARRAFSGKLRAAADSMGEQYAPTQTTSDITVASSSDTTTLSLPGTTELDGLDGEPTTVDVLITQTITTQDTATKTGTQTVGPLGTDVWSDSASEGG